MSTETRFVAPAPEPAPAGTSLLTLAWRLRRNQIEAFPRALFEEEVWRPFRRGALFAMSPEAVRTVLRDEADHFSSGALFRRMVRPVWGRGLLTAQGRNWAAQRRAAASAFRPNSMAALAPFFSSAAERAIERWTTKPNRSIDAREEMARITFDVILDAMLSGATDFDRATLSATLGRLFARVNRVPITGLLFPDRYHESRPSAHPLEREKLIASMRSMIATRRRVQPVGDLLDLLMQARDPENGQPFDDDLLADNLLGFIMAGHDTTTLALTWALFLVTSHAPTMTTLRAEVATVAGSAPIRAEHVSQLVFARQVISEALRLYPPAFLLTRVAGRDTHVAGERVRAGERVNIPIYAIHRRASSFADPFAFDPDRFHPSHPQPGRDSYLPFGTGARVCLGASFAMAEAVTVLATIVRAVELELCAQDNVWPLAQVSLRPRGSLTMHVVRR